MTILSFRVITLKMPHNCNSFRFRQEIFKYFANISMGTKCMFPWGQIKKKELKITLN